MGPPSQNFEKNQKYNGTLRPYILDLKFEIGAKLRISMHYFTLISLSWDWQIIADNKVWMDPLSYAEVEAVWIKVEDCKKQQEVL